MTDITLFIKDSSLRQLLRLELERIGKTVEENDGDCTVFITDIRDALNETHKNQILISREPEKEKNAVVLRRPVDVSELRGAVSNFFKQTEIKIDPKNNADTSIKLIEEEKAALVGGSKITLSENEFILLSVLIERKNAPISRDEINSLLNSAGNTPEVYICGLRKKLTQNDGVNPIITIRGKGYKLR